MRVVWTAPALHDLHSLRAYIEARLPDAGAHQSILVLEVVEGLAQFPQSGRPGRRPETRELVIGKTPYIAAHRIRGERIEVLRILHGRQRWPDAI